MRRCWELRTCALVIPLLFAAAYGFLGHGAAGEQADTSGLGALSALAPPDYIGSRACAACHAPEARAWQDSHHAKAMAHATEATVLGDFSGAAIESRGSKASFYRDGKAFVVETEGADGNLAAFRVDYTFGVSPLQQYLVTFPDGRLQALPWAWDTRSKNEGGQRWFHVYGDQAVPPGDPLHWTRGQQNWNHMCAECHSTAVHKGYDAKADKFHTSFSEISVGCESCHGPGAGHVDWANAKPARAGPSKGFAAVAAKRPQADWTSDPATGSPAKGISRPPGDEVETCARCHARRGTISEDWKPGQLLENTHMPVLLSDGLFEADGQMRDEVFNDHAFKQSLMYAKGVICSDCHDPHSGKLKAVGAEVCAQCHQPERFAAATHTGHTPGAAGTPDCIACHMPARTYMVVDRRHDHSFRIPRPDISARLGTPNTCNGCHADKPASWAADAITRWHGAARKGFQNWADAFQFARQGDPDALSRLQELTADVAVPAIVRATALNELARFPASAEQSLIEGLKDPEPLPRIAALRSLEGRPMDQRWRLAEPLLDDPILGVRIEAANLLADTGADALSPPDSARLEKAFADYETAQRLDADRPEGRSNLAAFYFRRGNLQVAEDNYLAALKLAPDAAAISVNLADLYRQTGRESLAEDVLRKAVLLSPSAASAHHALGLSLIRQKRYPEALVELASATTLDSDEPRFTYVYGIALRSLGRLDEAVAVWQKALKLHPWDTQVISALLDSALRHSNREEALLLAKKLAALQPDNKEILGIMDGLAQQ